MFSEKGENFYKQEEESELNGYTEFYQSDAETKWSRKIIARRIRALIKS